MDLFRTIKYKIVFRSVNKLYIVYANTLFLRFRFVRLYCISRMFLTWNIKIHLRCISRDIRTLFSPKQTSTVLFTSYMQIERSHGNLLMAQLLRYTRCNANATRCVYDNMQQSCHKALRVKHFTKVFVQTTSSLSSLVLLTVSTDKIMIQIIS